MKHWRFRFELYHLGADIGAGTAEEHLNRFLAEKHAVPKLISLAFVGEISRRLSVMMHYEVIPEVAPKVRIFYEGPDEEFGSRTPEIDRFLETADLLMDPVDCSMGDGRGTAQVILCVHRDKAATPAAAA